MSDTPETDAKTHDVGDSTKCLMVSAEVARKLERERDDLQRAVNGLCEHIGVSPANTTLLAVQVLRIERDRNQWEQLAIQYSTEREHNAMQSLIYKAERDQWKAEAKRWRDMYMQFDEMLEGQVNDAVVRLEKVWEDLDELKKKVQDEY